MCRHLAYLGPPESMTALLLDPAHSLAEQASAPRLQQRGRVNADGFGAGWYVPGRAAPVRYRRAQPIWTDASFASLAPTVSSGCVLAAVRSASPGMPPDESCAAPFTHRRWLFSHNGQVADLPSVRKLFGEAVVDVPEALAPVDSAVLFGLAMARWKAGASLGKGLAGVVSDVATAGGGRLNLLATDGKRLAGTASGDTLFVRSAPASVALASEPFDDGPGWDEVPPDSLVEAAPGETTITPLTVECP